MTATACPNCGGTMESIGISVGNILRCQECGKAIPASGVKTLKLPGLDRGPAHNTVPETEEPVMKRVIKALVQAGYQVETLVRRRKMQHCETCDSWFHQQGGDGVSKYIGDLLVAVPHDAPTAWILLDTKGTNGRGSAEQKETAAKGLLFFVRSEQEALCLVRQFETEESDK